MKRMKKIFSKIVTLALIVALLIPYTNLPKVQAETTDCDGEWEYHTNYYFFLEANNPHGWVSSIVNGTTKAYSSHYYTSFLYNFPFDGSTIEFDSENSGVVKLTENTTYNTSFIPSYTSKEWSVAQFYYEYLKEGNGAAGKYESYSYSGDQSGKDKDNSIVTYLYHGANAYAGETTPDEDADKLVDLNQSKLTFRTEGVSLSQTDIDKYVNATIYITEDDSSLSNVKIGHASQNLSTFDGSTSAIAGAIKDYNNSKGTLTSGSITANNGNPVISLLISRTYELNDIIPISTVNSVYGTNLSSVSVVANGFGNIALREVDSNTASTGNFNDPDKGILHFPDNNTTTGQPIYSGATTCKKDNDGNCIYISNTTSIDPVTDANGKVQTTAAADANGNLKVLSKQTSYYAPTTQNITNTHWFFAPTLYKLAYKVCKASSEATEDTVTVTYDGNESSVNTTNKADKVPSASNPITVGNDYTVSTDEPTLSGYTFKSWNLSKDCKGRFIEPGAKLEKLTNNTTLYACWGATGSTDQKGTGVLTYAGLFTGIIALAGGSYYLVKKKNIFKKI